MFCDYCRRLFTFQQPVLPYTPVSKPLKGFREQGAESVLRIEAQPSSPEPSSNVSNIKVFENVKDIFSPKLLWWKTKVEKCGLRKGETHAPSAECWICDMVYSDVSSSFVEALLGKEKDDVAFVYRLKGMTPFQCGQANPVPEAVVCVWLEVGEELLPMVKLKVAEQNCKYSRV
jgi:hypothetical protein